MTHSLFNPTPETSEHAQGVFVPDDDLSVAGSAAIYVRAGGVTILECHCAEGVDQPALVAALEAWLEAAYPVPGCQPPYVYEIRLL